MAKGITKKNNRRLKRQIRKTVGGLLMASAIVVAAIPVPDVAATPLENSKPASKVWIWDNVQTPTEGEPTGRPTGKPSDSIASYCENTIPYVPDNSIVYTSGDGRFQFAYVDPGSGIKVAVILNYNPTVLTDSTLTIPNTMEAFRKYKTTSTEGYYCLVTQDDEFMFYDVYEQDKDSSDRLLYTVPEIKYDDDKHKVPEGDTVHHIGDSIVVNKDQLVTRDGGLVYVEKETVTDEEGKVSEVEKIYSVDPLMVTHQKPCYYEQRELWGDKDDTELYYQKKGTVSEEKPDGELLHPMEQNHYRIDASVKYIGQQFIEAETDSYGNLTGWKVTGEYRDEPNDGVFANNANITNLIIGENLAGISDYAFQGCSTLQSVTFGNNLTTIGNGAFANCIRLSNCEMASNSNIQALGKDAFYNCTALTSISVPVNVKAIGDSCFEGCSRLQNVDLCGGSEFDTMLSTIGNSAFKNCSSLSSVTFPTQYNENNIQIGIFEGCISLQYVKVPNKDANFVEDSNSDGYTFKKFKENVPESFYFWGADTKTNDRNNRSSLHVTANDNEIAYKYWDQNVYEVVVAEDPTDPMSPKITYQVNDQNELVKIWREREPKNVIIPKTIGPYGISSIGTGCFNDACSIECVTIPETVINIAEGAFKGSHNLKTVIFTDATTIQSIGNDAFKTQEASCGDTLKKDDPDTPDINEGPSLTFVGAMMNSAGEDTVPFIYAMNGISNINNSNQEKIWITCHSGWPTNLEVQYYYDPISNSGEAQLIGYPRYDMIQDTASAMQWVHKLPYRTDENEESYLNMVINATKYYQASDEEKKNMTQPTENEMAIVNAALNVVVPNSVDSIKPGLFSGYIADKDGELKESEADGSGEWDKVTNFLRAGSSESLSKPDTDIQTIVLNGVKKVDPFTFKNCSSLREAAIIGPSYIDYYAFDGLDDDRNLVLDSGETRKDMQLQTVTLGTNLTDTGKRPFRGCENLTTVTCLDSDFSYNNGIIYRNTGSGTEVVECLESRGAVGGIGSYSVGPEELAGVTSIKEEAFADCDDVGKVDLSVTVVDTIPEGCFKETDDLNSVVLPDTVKSIEAESFKDSSLRLLTIPGTQSYIAQDAFMTGDWVTKPSDREVNPGTEAAKKQQTIIFECLEGTTADRYAKEYWYINPEYGRVYLEHMVYFWDYPDYPDTSNKELFYKVKVKDGEDAVPPTETPSHTGYPFSRWTDYTNVTRDIDVYPVFGANVYAVTFLSYDGSTIGEVQYIEEGKSAIPPTPPVREGYTFDKWSQDWNNVTEDRNIVALYTDNSGDASRHQVIFYDYDGTTIISKQSVNDGEAAIEPKSPTRSGYTFIGWVPSDFSKVEKDMNIVANYEKNTSSGGSGSGSGSGSSSDSKSNASSSASPSASPEVTKYTVSVSGGSGSGSYPAGAIVAINAYFLGDGQNFDKWTTSTAGVGFANPNASSTTFTMPAANVAITATYKTGSGSSGSTGGNGSGSGGSGGSSTANTNSGSTVQVTKPGISNTGLAGATVSGATDNFIIKVSEDQSAADAAVAALQAKYGDLSRIKYFPMDISLYDSTGRTKIADTSGISVNITLPLPDELVQYAGNNKIAAVSNGSLEDLSARFTTIDGVPCINFTATHFSPYVIYVDTANLTAGTIDTTPKTGDPIHPKWFLAIGMACISLILFFKKDKAVVRPKRA